MSLLRLEPSPLVWCPFKEASKERCMVGKSDFYDLQYRRFATDLASDLRREVYGEDLGQQGS
jgi:hypothetical protein